MDSSLSLSSWYRGIHCYALYQSWWQTKSSCHFPFFSSCQEWKQWIGECHRVLRLSADRSGVMIHDLFSVSTVWGFGRWTYAHTWYFEKKSLQHSPTCEKPKAPQLTRASVEKLDGNGEQQVWARVSEYTALESQTADREEGVWSPLVRVWISFFPCHILPLCFVVDPTNKVPYYIHWSRLINLEVIHSLMISRFATLVWQSVQTGGHLHNCTFAHVNNYLLWSLLVENAKPFKLLTSPVFTTMSQVHCHCQSSCHCQSCCHCHRQLPGSLTFWLDIKVTAIQLPEE